MPGGEIFHLAADLFRRPEQEAGDFVSACYGFDEPVVGVVFELEAAIFHRKRLLAFRSWLSVWLHKFTANCANADC